MMKNVVIRVPLILLGGLLLAVSGFAPSAQAQTPPPAETFSWLAPLEKAADALQQRYGRPITYEDPIWRWRGDLEVRGRDRLGEEILRVKTHTLVMPAGLTPGTTPTLGVAELTKVLDAYREQNPERTRFRVQESGMWLHILPAEAHDETGAFRPAGSLLDTPVSVPVASRTPSEHLIALCEAVTRANTDHFTLRPNIGPEVGGSFDQEFAANGYILRGNLRTLTEPRTDDDERPYIVTEWGSSAPTAREALIDLLGRSGTTVTWHLKCVEGDSICFLNVQPLMVQTPQGIVTMRVLDRCHNCRTVPVRHDVRPR